jgi:hypothetical protein
MESEVVRDCKCGVPLKREGVELVTFSNKTKHYRVRCDGCRKIIYLKARLVEGPQPGLLVITLQELKTFEDKWTAMGFETQHEILETLAQWSKFFMSLMKQHADRRRLSPKQLACVAETLSETNTNP